MKLSGKLVLRKDDNDRLLAERPSGWRGGIPRAELNPTPHRGRDAPLRRLPRGDAALHPQGAQGAPFQWLTEEPESLVEIIFPGQDWIVMVADSPALPGDFNSRSSRFRDSTRHPRRLPVGDELRGIILTQRGKGWHHPPGRPRVRVCTGFFTVRTRHCLSPGKMALTRARAPAGPFPRTPGHRTGTGRENICVPEKPRVGCRDDTGPGHFRSSRFPAGYPAHLPTSAPATATTPSSPATRPGWAGSSVFAP